MPETFDPNPSRVPRPLPAWRPSSAVGRLVAALVTVLLSAGWAVEATAPAEAPHGAPATAVASPSAATAPRSASHDPRPRLRDRRIELHANLLGLDETAVATLLRGETVVLPGTAPGLSETAQNGDGEAREISAQGRALRVLPSPPDRLARAAIDWPHYPEFFPFVTESEVVPGPAASAPRVRQRIDLPFPFPDRRLTVDTAWRDRRGSAAPEADFEITWSHVPGSGNVNAQEGGWRFWHLPESTDTLVELRLASDAGAGVPESLQARALLETLEWALDGLRQQVNRCRYDLPRHSSCTESAALPPPWDETTASAGDSR